LIEVVVRNKPVGRGSVFYHEPSLVRYVGEVLPNPKHIADDCITLSGDDIIPYRVIPRKDIVSMGGRAVEFKAAPVTTQTWRVAGSKGAEYVVTHDHGRWSCTCVGYQFHKNCKHIREKK
jgi:hypothetical protein